MSDPYFRCIKANGWLKLMCLEGYVYDNPDFDDDEPFVSISAHGADEASSHITDPDILDRFAQVVTDAAAWLRAEQARMAEEKAAKPKPEEPKP